LKRFRFELEKLLELRAYRERETEIELAHAMAEAVDIQRKIEALIRERAAIGETRFAPGRSVGEIRSSDLYILRLDQQKETLIKSAAKAELKVEQARSIYLEAAKDRKVLEKLKEKRKNEHRKAGLLEEVKTLDDLSGGAETRRSATQGV
jgi:flagellar FliJ protein